MLVSGPSGSGKSMLARAIHAWSPVATGPLEVMSCASVPEPLQGRELFGCVAGTYPALPEAYAGALARAEGGTLLLESLDALGADARRALARVLADSRYRPEGSSESLPVGARIVATTEGPLGDGAFAGPHQEIRLTSLAERPEDVLPLAAHFLARFAAEAGTTPVGFTADARSALLAEPWPGNVGELRERIRQAIALERGGAVSAEALLLAADSDEIPSFREAKRAFETRYVVTLLRRCEGNISQAARLAKKDRKDFYDVIRRTGVDPADFR